MSDTENEPKRYWGYRPVLKKGKPYKIGNLEGVDDDSLVLEEVHYEDDVPVARDGGRAFRIGADEGPEGMIAMLETAIRHIRERGVLEDPWPDEGVSKPEREKNLSTALGLALSSLVKNEPGDSRLVSDEFVAMAAVHAGTENEEHMKIIHTAAADSRLP